MLDEFIDANKGYAAAQALTSRRLMGATSRAAGKEAQRHRVVVPKFLVVMAVGLALNTLIMHVGVNRFGVHYVLAQLAAIAVVLSMVVAVAMAVCRAEDPGRFRAPGGCRRIRRRHRRSAPLRRR